MLRRPFSVPSPAEVPFLAGLLRGESPGPQPAPDRLAAAAIDHKVVGYLLDAQRQGRVDLPEDLGELLRDHRAREALAGALLRRELSLVEPVIREACGAPPVLIKGPAVAQRLYPDPLLRPFGDLDLMVPRERLLKATEALRSGLGYEHGVEPWTGYGENVGHEVGVERTLGGQTLRVELHWRLCDDPIADRLGHSRLLGSAATLSLCGDVTIPVPRAEDDIVVLAVHLVHDPVKRLIWINDLVLAAERASEAEWGEAFAVARELGLGWVLERGLDYAQTHLGYDRPRPVGPSPPPPWGPLRVGERMDGWLSYQLGQLATGGWLERNGYLRLATRGRLSQLGRWLRSLGRP